MKTIKYVFVMLLSVSLCSAMTQAQPAPDRQESQTASKIAQDVLIIIQQERVRFTTRSAVEEMRLQIFDQAGQPVYDSGAVTGQELTWGLRQAGGEAVKSGLYAYTLSVKEAGAAEPQLRRGHFIVDLAKERDGKTDRLWITSQNDGGVGTELTVARNEGETIAGTSSLSDQKSVRGAETVTDGKESELKESESTAAAAAIAGTTGRIAKFTSAIDLGNSVMTEANGNIGIGTTNPALLSGASGRILSITDPLNPGVALTNTGTGGNQFLLYSSNAGSAGSGAFRIYDANNMADRVVVSHSGNVGIGPTIPQGKLDVSGNIVLNGDTRTQLFAYGDVVAIKGRGVEINASPNGSGILGIGGNPNDNAVFLFGYNSDKTRSAAAMWFAGKDGGKLPLIQMSANTTYIDSNVGIGTISPAANLDVNGSARVGVLQIVGGADFAENFEVSEATSSGEDATPKVEPGMVVSLDPASPGKLTLSARGYDRRVAGVVSGAGGVKPGMVMSHEGTLADGKFPVALTGRVYCWVDASQGAIEVGDLLTTSTTPGHAMKAMDTAKAQGAIIGKAMTTLKSGKGLVLVLVNLQ